MCTSKTKGPIVSILSYVQWVIVWVCMKKISHLACLWSENYSPHDNRLKFEVSIRAFVRKFLFWLYLKNCDQHYGPFCFGRTHIRWLFKIMRIKYSNSSPETIFHKVIKRSPSLPSFSEIRFYFRCKALEFLFACVYVDTL